MKNNEWKRVYQSLVALVLFVILIILASGMDGMSGGFAIMFIGFFLAVTSFFVAILFFTRARTMDTIFSGTNLLAHWTYPEEEMRKSAEREYAEYREINRSLLYVVGGFILIAMIGMLIFGGDAGLSTAGILFIVFILCAITSVAAPVLNRNRTLNASREAWISPEGIIYEGAVYPFSSFLMRMDGVRYRNATGRHPALLGFSFTQLVGLYIVRPFEVSIPVPPGEESNAQQIARMFAGEVVSE